MTKTALNMEKLAGFLKSRGFVFPSSEIYGGFAAIYDYGHYGILLKENIRQAWWKSMVQMRDDVYGLDSAIFMHPKAWIASGHVESFDDPQVDCKKCKTRFRADHMLEAFGIDADKQPLDVVNAHLDELRHEGKLKCSNCGSKDLTSAKRFSLMVKSNIGSPTDELSEENVVYLRPETCGGIYLEYKNMMDSVHPNLPFGIAQVGKAFRNEIIARQFIFRTREFEQMEMQYFLAPQDMEEKYKMWQDIRWQWFLEYGMGKDEIRWHKHTKLSHYASEAYDIEYNFKCLNGFKEIEGIHARGDWDLSQHSKFSGQNLTYFDQKTNERFIPHIMETSVGLGRLFLMFIDQAYNEEELEDGTTRVILKLDKRLAPVKVAVFPLLRNKENLVTAAKELAAKLKPHFQVELDDRGNIGKRYRKQDEIGTPYCVTVDFDTVEKGEVTIRHRDTMKQEKVALDKVLDYLKKEFDV
ncbi:MAG: glycine--tRNA ligase [Pseudomonadales bacterium]|jgi:glycyl-tRNA synthetase|nr:glycine--tRNA ligase [Pseudomonadales bacterium]